MKLKIIEKKLGVRFTTGYTEIAKIPTGVFMFDFLTGGGVPMGRITLLWGKKGSAKTYVAMRTIASAQRRCVRCCELLERCKCKDKQAFEVLYVDAEATWNTQWAQRLGIDVERLNLFRPVSAEEVIDVVYEVIKEGAAHLICIDSVAALEPQEEEKKLAAEWTQGLMARLMGKGVRKWTSAMNALFRDGQVVPALVIINQSRYKIGGYVPTETLPGGLALGYASTLEVKFWTEKGKITSGVPEWNAFAFEVIKNKEGPNNLVGTFKMVVMDNVIEHKKAGDVVEEEDVLAVMLRLGEIKKVKGGYEMRGKVYKNQEEILNYFLINPDEFFIIKEELVKKGCVLL